MTEMIVHPTGTCFDDALDYLEAIGREGELDLRRHKLCHGICINPDGDEYAHAWVEELPEPWLRGPSFVWGGGIFEGKRGYYQVKRDEFYGEFKVQEVRRYSVEEAWQENLKSGNYGPWIPEYRALCKNAGANQ